MNNLSILAWEIIPGYDIAQAEWWVMWFVVLGAVVAALIVFLIVFFFGYFKMTKEERATINDKKKQLKAIKDKKEKKEFKANLSKPTRLVLSWKTAQFIVYPVFAFVVIVSMVATPILYTYWDVLYSTLVYTDTVVVNETTKLAAAEATENVVNIEKEGIVLLQNDKKVLPLDIANNKKVNVFGSGAFGIFYGNGGSGEFATDHTYKDGRTLKCVKLEEALVEEGFEFNPYLLNLCKNYAKNNSESISESDYNLHASIATFGTTGRYEGIKPRWIPYEHEPQQAAYEKSYEEIGSQTLLEYSKEYSDTAIYCISRYGTESADLPMSSMNESELNANERAIIKMLKDNFKNVVILMNTPGPMKMSQFKELGVDTVLFVGHPGLTGTRAIAQVLSGKVNPSGRTVDTWAYDLESNPTYETFGKNDFRFSNKNTKFTNYLEGIYVGYRYYTTRAIQDEDYDYNEYVKYSFGHGLSYTTFNTSLVKSTVDLEKGEVEAIVEVKNTGDKAGKYVIELYDTPPYVKGGIEKAAFNLVAYQKTNELAPGKAENYELKFKIRDLASWDSNNGYYVCEKGKYNISVRENVWDIAVDKEHNRQNSFEISLDNDIEYKKSYQTGKEYSKLFEDAEYGPNTDKLTYLSRADFEGTYTKHADVNLTWDGTDKIDNNSISSKVYQDNLVPDVEVDADLDERITVRDMKNAAWDDSRWDDFISQMSQKDMEELVAGGNFATPAIKSIEKPASSEGDGPASCYNSGTGHPSGVILASTWNNDAAELFGKSCGKEGSAMGLTGWYAPGMNIHRSPLAGRNFEYYSEDPLISGNMGGYTAIGAIQMGVYTFAKHFGVNEQETDRNGINVFVNEQGLREIYLKPFEIYSDLGGLGMMSAFSSVGTTWAGASEALCWKLLRDEWGFKGSVITDYNNDSMPCSAGLRAGNDEWLIPAKTSSGSLNRAKNQTPHDIVYFLKRASKNILYSIVHSNAAWDDADFEAIGVINPRS